jgi:hypothetical protein
MHRESERHEEQQHERPRDHDYSPSSELMMNLQDWPAIIEIGGELV